MGCPVSKAKGDCKSPVFDGTWEVSVYGLLESHDLWPVFIGLILVEYACMLASFGCLFHECQNVFSIP